MIEIDIIENLQAGKVEELEKLMNQYNSLVYRVLLRFCKITGDLDDLVQEVWIKVYYQIKKLKKRESFKAWLTRIAYNLGVDYLKKNIKRYQNREFQDDIPQEDDVDLFQKETERIIWEELKKLKLKYQFPLILYYFEQFTYEEIAKISETKLNTVKSFIKRGKQMLKDRLQQRGIKDGSIR